MDEVRWLDVDEMRSWRAFIKGSETLLTRLDAELQSEHGLSLSEYEVLVVLSEAEFGIRMKDLASMALQSRSRLTHTCNRLERDGLMVRTKCPTDGRGLVALLTDAGWERLRTCAPTHVRGVRRYLIDVLSHEEQAVIAEAMTRVFDVVSETPQP
ncbi:MAG: MarR family winged helix-turn-helix transcriptional regulator [Acidimicrobiia bacterium]